MWKITDFGLTSEGTSNTLQTTIAARGTTGYRAPELLQDGKRGYSGKTDVWSVGCIFYELLVGERPFSEDWAVIRHVGSNAPLSIPQHILHDLDPDWEPPLTALLNGMLQLDPQSRVPIVNLLRQFAFHYELTCCDDSRLYFSYRTYGLPYNIAKSARPVMPYSIRFCSSAPYFAQMGHHNATIWKLNEKGTSDPVITPNVGDPHKTKQITAIATGKLRDTETAVIALSNVDRVIMVYDAETAVELTRYQAFQRVTSLAIDHDGGQLAYGTYTGNIIITNIQSEHAVKLSHRRSLWLGQRVEHVGFHPKPDTLISAVTVSEVVVMNTFGMVFLRCGRMSLQDPDLNFDPFIYSQMFNPVRNEFLVCIANRICIYDVSTANGRRHVIEAQGCTRASYSPCGNYILVSYHEQDTRVWNSSGGDHFLFEIPDISGDVWFCNNGKGLCFVGPNIRGEVNLLDFTAEMRRMNVK
jgi:hypothetical protein